MSGGVAEVAGEIPSPRADCIYIVFFFEEPGLVRIVRVLHGAMDIEVQFAEKISTPDDKT